MRNLRYALLSAAILGVVSAHADFIEPNSLTFSPDGPGDDVQSQLTDMGYTSSVGSETGNVVNNYGDQLDADLFQECSSPMTWTIAYQFAAYAPHHRLGYYTDLGSSTPAITWVLGGSSTGLPTTATLDIAGKFGLAFDSGDNGSGPNSIYYSQIALNVPTYDHLATIDLKGPNVSGCSMLASWEDLNLGDHDYNDFGVVMQNTMPVPEPASMGALTIGVLALARKRKRA